MSDYTTLTGKWGTYVIKNGDPRSVINKNGKFGITYIGLSLKNNSKVIVKQLNPALAKNDKAIALFLREADLTPDHPGFTRTLDCFRFMNQYFVVREYIDGFDLKAAMKSPHWRKLLRGELGIQCIIKVLDSLDVLHTKGIVHRDIKPSNILIESEINKPFVGFNVRLTDLGMARYKEDLAPFEKEIQLLPFSMLYAPPEQVLNIDQLVDFSSDIFSCGIVLYEMFTNKTPIAADNAVKLMTLQVSLPSPPHYRIPPHVFEVIRKATFKSTFPKPPHFYSTEQVREMLIQGQLQRYQNVSEFKEALLDAWKQDKPSMNRISSRIALWMKDLFIG